MTKPTFNNRPNECVTTTDGRKFFISRSPAVIPQIYALVDKELFILVNRRGPGCPDHIGKWALPCGYLDWDESAEEAARREIYEECDFDITTPGRDSLWSLEHWCLVTKPKRDTRQNILMHMTQGFVASQLPAVTKVPDRETSEVMWMPVTQALETDFAFGHQYNILECLHYRRSCCFGHANNLDLPKVVNELIVSAPEEVQRTVSQRNT